MGRSHGDSWRCGRRWRQPASRATERCSAGRCSRARSNHSTGPRPSTPRTRTRVKPGRGAGLGRSRSTRASGSPGASTTAARTRISSQRGRLCHRQPPQRRRALALAPCRRGPRAPPRCLFPLTGVTREPACSTSGCGAAGAARARARPRHHRRRPRRPARLPGPVRAGRRDRALPFADGEFDLAYSTRASSSTSRPRGARVRRRARRVARGWYVQTPAFSFPVEPHALLPSRTGCRRRCAPLLAPGRAGDWEEIHLLRRAEMARLFGPPVAERVGPLVKSWVSVRPI